MSGLVVDVSELIARPGVPAGGRKVIRRGVALPGLRGALGWLGESDVVELDLVADGVTDGIVVGGTLSGTMHLSCSRCLVTFDQAFRQPVDEWFGFAGSGNDGEDEGYEVRDDRIDLEPLVRDVIVLAIPTRPLHDEACQGLCPTCGGDRNVVDCGHSQKLEDLRWAPLDALRALGELGMERSS
ncbi:MAG TPA: DUF177 domain-containing protein [Actinomycetota bacterium]|nr:DUF177 domain-containing protein [Actinomycetota bacterium]